MTHHAAIGIRNTNTTFICLFGRDECGPSNLRRRASAGASAASRYSVESESKLQALAKRAPSFDCVSPQPAVATAEPRLQVSAAVRRASRGRIGNRVKRRRIPARIPLEESTHLKYVVGDLMCGL